MRRGGGRAGAQGSQGQPLGADDFSRSHQAPLRAGLQQRFSDLTVSGSRGRPHRHPCPLDVRKFTKVWGVGGWISLPSCRQWVQGLVADKATAFWEPKLSNYSQGSLCHGLKALNTRITLGRGDTEFG